MCVYSAFCHHQWRLTWASQVGIMLVTPSIVGGGVVQTIQWNGGNRNVSWGHRLSSVLKFSVGDQWAFSGRMSETNSHFGSRVSAETFICCCCTFSSAWIKCVHTGGCFSSIVYQYLRFSCFYVTLFLNWYSLGCRVLCVNVYMFFLT